MAGRKPRLFDTVSKQWIDFSSLQEADSLFKDKERNPFVNSKEYGITSRYRYEEPLNNMELLSISLGGKPENINSTAAKTYKQLNPDVDLESRKTPIAIGVNPILDRDYNFKKAGLIPDKPVYYKDLDEYWGFDSSGNYTNNIPENIVGSSARRKLLAESKDDIEERDKWISEYFNFIEGGVGNMSEEALLAYADSYARGNEKMLSKNPQFDPRDPYVVKSRALTDLGGKYALKNLLEESNIERNEDTEGLFRLAELNNTEFAKLSELNPDVDEYFNRTIEQYMLRYYGKVANKYADEPTNVVLDIEKHGRYNKDRKLIAEDIADKTKDRGGWSKIGWGMIGVIASMGNSIVNHLGTLLKETFDSDTIINQQRDRAADVIDKISERLALRKLTSSSGDPNLIKQDIKDFDELAAAKYNYYRLNEVADAAQLTPEKKRELLHRYKILASTVGEQIADNNLVKELTEIDYDNQGTIKRLGYTFNNTLNTIGTTTLHIANMAAYAPLAVGDVLQSGINAARNSEEAGDFLGNWWDNMGDEIYDTWQRSLDNPFVNYLADVESTGTWNAWYDFKNPLGILRSLDYYKKLGVNANKILRHYGEENKLWATSTMFDIVPVTGYMAGAALGTKGVNLISNVLRGVEGFNKVGAVHTAMRAALAEDAISKGTWNAMSKGLLLTHKFTKPVLGKTATFMDATAPALSTAGMDFGYAKNNYDEGMESARAYVNSSEFEKLVNDRINSETLGVLLEGGSIINLTLDDKIFFNLLNPNFAEEAQRLAKEHNSQISDLELPWDLEDAAKELILKPFKDEYLNEAKKIATFNAGLTFGLTILPDVHITNTWRKAMFSSLSRGAMNSIAQNKFFKPVGKLLGIKPNKLDNYFTNIRKVDGKWTINGKPMTRRDLLDLYIQQSVAGFTSNYLQDVGVAAGKGLLESLLSQYIDLRFGDKTTDAISYDIDLALLAAADKAGVAFGEATSFRDGLYGAIAPWIFSPVRGIRETANSVGKAAKKGTMPFLKSLITEPLLKNSLLYNVTFGAKDIINKENLRREAFRNTVETWLNSNGRVYVDNIGGLLDLSAKEDKAVKDDDYIAFLLSKLGLITLAAMMLSLVLDFLPIKATIMLYMKERALRKVITLEDIDRVAEEANTIMALQQEANAELQRNERMRDESLKSTTALESLLRALDEISPEDKSIIKDLVDIRLLNKDINRKDTRTEAELLNDIKKVSELTLSSIDNVNKYLLEAETLFGEAGDLVLKQEYARLRLYEDLLRADVKEKEEVLDKINKGIKFSSKEASTKSTIPVDDKFATFVSQFSGDVRKVQERVQSVDKDILGIKDAIRKVEEEVQSKKVAKKQAKTDKVYNDLDLEMQAAKQFKSFLLEQLNVAMLEKAHLQLLVKDYDNLLKSLEEPITPVIAASDILSLSEPSRLALLRSKTLSKALLAEVDTFNSGVWSSNDIENTNVTSYTDLIESKLYSENLLKRLSYEGKLSPEAILRVAQYSENRRNEAIKNVYAKQYEAFAAENLYHTKTVPNTTTEVSNDETGSVIEKEVTDEKLPEISESVDDLQAYENFLKKYKDKVLEIELQDDKELLLAGLNLALKDSKNSLYQKMLNNLKEYDKAIADVKKYIDSDVFSLQEKRELEEMINFATMYKSVPADGIMKAMTSKDDTFMQQLSDFLKSKGMTPGSIDDIRNRILQYDNNITTTMEKNKKAEGERTKLQEEKKEVKEALKGASSARFNNAINAISTYTMAELGPRRTPMRELLRLVGVLDADNVVVNSNNFIDAVRDIIIEASNKASSDTQMDKALEEAVANLKNKSDSLLSEEDFLKLDIVIPLVLVYYHMKTNSFKTFKDVTIPPSNNNSNTNQTLGEPKKPVTKFPLELLRWQWSKAENERNTLGNLLANANIDLFFRNYTVTPSTKVVFIAANKWVKGYEEGGKKYKGVEKEITADRAAEKGNPDIKYEAMEALPIVAAIEISSYRDGCLSVGDKYYQIIGLLPGALNRKIAGLACLENVQSIRSDAVRLLSNNNSDEPYLITERVEKDGKVEEKLLFTTMDKPEPSSVQIDLDSPPQPLEIAHHTLITQSMFSVEEKDGRPVVKTNMTPSSNKTSTNRANWALVHVTEIENTKNEEGKTISELEDKDAIINFNSRTKGFAEALAAVIEHLKNNTFNIESVVLDLNEFASDASSNKSKTSLNSRVNDSKVALLPYISLADDYNFLIKNNDAGDLVLYVGNTSQKPMRKEDRVVKEWIIISSNQNKVVPTDLILKDLISLKYSRNNLDESIAKWLVNWGNFKKFDIGYEYKQLYIKQAVKDGILNAYDVKVEYEPIVDAVLRESDKRELELINLDIQRRAEQLAAQRQIDNSMDPVTGEPNAGIDINDLIDLINNNEALNLELKDKYVSMLTRIQSIQRMVENRRGKDRLKINQSKPSEHNTSTTLTANLERGTESLKRPKHVIVTGVCGTVADRIVRLFFNPSVKDKVEALKQFKEEAKEVFNSMTIDHIWEACEKLNETLESEHIKVISTGIYTIDEEMNNRLVGELDLFGYNTITGEPIIIDIKTYSGDLFYLVTEGENGHNYPAQLSTYKADLSRNTGTPLPNNLRIYALRLDIDSNMYNVQTDKNNISTVTKKKAFSSAVEAKKNVTFEPYNVEYIGDEAVGQRRLERLKRYYDEQIKAKETGEEESLEINVDEEAQLIEELLKSKEEKENLVIIDNSNETKELPTIDPSQLPPELRALIEKDAEKAMRLEAKADDLSSKTTEDNINELCKGKNKKG